MTPNQPMEPAINADLKHEVTPPFDLTFSPLVLLGHKRKLRSRFIYYVALKVRILMGSGLRMPAVMETYALLRLAAARRQPVAAFYDGRPRLLCPHVLGRKADRLHALVYQFGGGSNSGLPVTPEGVGGWRCFAVEKLSQVELRTDAWRTEPRSRRQICLDEIDFDVDQPEESPQ